MEAMSASLLQPSPFHRAARPLASPLSNFSSKASLSSSLCRHYRSGSMRLSVACSSSVQTSSRAENSEAPTESPPLVSTEQVGESEVADRQRLFNRIAPMYDMLNDWLSLGQHRVWKRMAVAWSRVKQGDSVLDICCGSGDVAFLLAEKVGSTGSVVGLDYAQEQLDVAYRRQLESIILSSAEMNWCLGDALDLPFKDASFDAVTMAYGLRNVANIPLALKEIYDVLKPGSKASILDFNRSENLATVGFQGWMLDNVVVPVATQFGLEDEYTYLKTSIARFPTGAEQETLALETGFSKAVHYELAGGLMGVLVLTK